MNLSAIRHKSRFPRACEFVRKLDERHSFLMRKRFLVETPKEFLTRYDAGTALEGLRARYRKYRVWWKDGHEFRSNRGGLPAKWRNYLYVLRVPVGEGAYV